MRIPCPFCGERESSEFDYRGQALQRPEQDEGLFAYVYLRDNVAGVIAEHWYHSHGCRRWIELRRDTRTHEILGSAFARDLEP